MNMKGFRININGQYILGAVPLNGTAGVVVNSLNSIAYIDFGGTDGTNLASKWYVSDLKQGDRITVCFEEINQLSDFIEVTNSRYTDEQIQLILDVELKRYHALKQELINDGLIND